MLLAVCLSILFAQDGPLCPLDRLGLVCECNECFEWDDDATARTYEVHRNVVASPEMVMVGVLVRQDWTDDDGDQQTSLPAVWCPAKDTPFPHEDELYEYRIRACNGAGCSELSDPIQYRAAPYACFDGAGEVPCYAGDAVIPR